MYDTSQWRDRILDWAQHWREEGRVLSGEISVEFGRPDLRDWKFHWNRTIDLCAGLSQDIEGEHPSSSEARPILSLLQAPTRTWRTPSRLDGGRLLASPLLSSEALAESEQNGLSSLSAFDDRAWDWVRKGWELNEFYKRRKWTQDYEKQRAEIIRTHGRDTADANSELKRLDAWRRSYPHRAPWSTASDEAALLR